MSEKEPTNNFIQEAGLDAVIGQLRKNKETLERSLEGRPFHYETIPVDKLRQIIAIKKKLEQIKAKDKADRVALSDIGERREVSLSNFDSATGYLDSIEDLWQAKFTTGEGEPSDKDSIYYITPRGVSLRLKRVELEEKGLAGVIQPFCEKIFFISSDGKRMSVKPVVGHDVREYITPEFLSLQRSDQIDTDFTSRIRQYEIPDGNVFVQKPEDLSERQGVHSGHAINNIVYYEEAK